MDNADLTTDKPATRADAIVVLAHGIGSPLFLLYRRELDEKVRREN